MAWYRAGTVSVTNNNSAVLGAGTAWVTAAAIGETFLGPDGQSYEIVAINSATSLTIAPVYKGSTASAQSYAIMPTQGYLRDLAAAAAALVESYNSVKNNAGTGKFAAGTSANPSLRNAADENTGLNLKGSDQLALVTAGVERLAVSASGVPSGTAVTHMLDRANHTGTQPLSSISGVGSAAALDATTSSTDNTAGRVLRVGDGGLNSAAVSITSITTEGILPAATSSFVRTENAFSESTMNFAAGFLSSRTVDRWGQMLISTLSATPIVTVRATTGVPGATASVRLRHTGNTTVDANGFIKNASPVIRLYSDRIEAEGFYEETPVFEKLEKGVYRISGTSGLSESGWYIETPSDRNGNKYFNIEWSQDKTPQLDSEGYVSNPQDVTLVIRTFERVWNPQTGLFDNGSPVDISRFVSLRFNEMRQTQTPENYEPEA